MSVGNIVVSQDAPAKNNLWIQPKGTARFWNGSIWKTLSGGGGGGSSLIDLIGDTPIGGSNPIYWTGENFSIITGTLSNNISGTVNGHTISSTINNGTANRLAYYTNSGIDDASTTYVSDTKLAINSISEPSYNFYVNGTSCFTDNLYINNARGIRIGNNATSSVYQDVMRLDSYNDFIIGNGTSASGYTTYLDGNVVNIRYGTNHTSGIYLNSSGNVGIGTNSPSYKLVVNGSAWFGNTTSATNILYLQSSACQLRIYANSNGNCYIEAANSAWTDNVSNGVLYLTGRNGGNIPKIGLNATTVQCSNDLYASGGVTALTSVSSDKRLKKNIKPFNALGTINKLNPVQFEWNKKANKYNNNLKLGIKNYGLIAQDSDNVIDEFVFDLPDGKGYKGVRYEKLIPILLQAVKEQQKEIDELKQIIKKLKV